MILERNLEVVQIQITSERQTARESERKGKNERECACKRGWATVCNTESEWLHATQSCMQHRGWVTACNTELHATQSCMQQRDQVWVCVHAHVRAYKRNLCLILSESDMTLERHLQFVQIDLPINPSVGLILSTSPLPRQCTTHHFMYIYICMCIHICIHIYMCTYIRTYLHTHARTYIRTCIHTYNTHTSTHPYTRTTNTHTLALSLPRTLSPSLSFSFSDKHEQENRE